MIKRVLTSTGSRRSAIIFAALACGGAVLVASGCASSGSGSNATPDRVALAAMRSTSVSGYRMTMNMRISSPALPTVLTATGHGAFDVRDQTGALSLTMNLGNNPQVTQVLGGSTLRIEEIMKWPVIYMKLPTVLASNLPGAGAKPWLKIDVTKAAAAAGAPGLSSLANNPAASDPSQLLQYLRAVSGNISQSGKEQVGGIATTHYSATIELNKVPNTLPEASRFAVRQSVGTLAKMLGKTTLPVDVWIDNQNLVRRMRMSYGLNSSGKAATITTTLEITQYGPQSAPALPPAGQVAEAGLLAGSTP
jgi:hypothetical protein